VQTVVSLSVLLKISIKSKEINKKALILKSYIYILRKAPDQSGLMFFLENRFNSRINVFRKSL
jgi:hypothetical protein